MTEYFQATELLRAANPATNFDIDHERLDQIINRVVSMQVFTRRSTFRAWKMKSASAVAGAAVVITAVVVSLGGGTPGLPSLALSATSRTAVYAAHGSLEKSAGSHPPPSGATFPTVGSYTFIAGSGLSLATSLAPVYAISEPADASSALMSVASALGVTNPVLSGTSSCQETATGNNANVYSQCGLVAAAPTSWYYNVDLPACQGLITNAAGLSVPCVVGWGFTDSSATPGRLTQWSAPLVQALAPSGVTLGNPTFNDNVITYPCEINGVPITGCSEMFQYNNGGKLIYATGTTGPVGPFTQLGVYPLISPLSGVSVMNESVPSVTTSQSSFVVTLKSSVLTYAMESLTNGTTVLVPQYTYTGSDNASYSALALDPSYFTTSSSK
jgi:hypothetical protein